LSLDLDDVRAQFPALRSGFAFFDNAGGSLVLRTVAERISEYLLTTSVQLGASYSVSADASERVAQSRAAIGRLVNAARPEEIVLGPSTTVLLRFLATAMASRLEAGDEIVVTTFDHESNIGPWLALQKRGVVLRFWTLDPDAGAIDLGGLDALMTERTRLVAVTHASNILGSINPIAEIAKFVHARGAEICVVGVAYAPHRAIDVQALGVDYYVFSFYKTYGPHYAMLYGRYEKLLELDGLYHYFYGRDKVPTKLEPGNCNYELAYGTAGIVDYLENLGGGTGNGETPRSGIDRAFAAIAEHEERLCARLLDYLGHSNRIHIVGERTSDRTRRVPTVSFKVHGRDSAEVVAATDRDRIGIRYGDFHSRRLVEHLGLAEGNGVVRVSMVHYNTLAEVDRLIESLDRTLA
jgi:cysteine desulfurase family protein (TIGR01976 family)